MASDFHTIRAPRGIWPSRDEYDRAAERALSALTARGIQARMVGSYAQGRLDIPYSDIDVLAIARTGEGARTRDAVIDAARALDDAVCVTIDPFADEAIVYSIHETGLQIDWFVVERIGDEQRRIWHGERPQPIDVTCRAWSSLLYTLSLLLKDDSRRGLAARDLAEIWVWLSGNGVDVSSLPASAPAATDDLPGLIAATAKIAPPDDRLSKILYSRLD